jgi:hypothetical protein
MFLHRCSSVSRFPWPCAQFVSLCHLYFYNHSHVEFVKATCILISLARLKKYAIKLAKLATLLSWQISNMGWNDQMKSESCLHCQSATCHGRCGGCRDKGKTITGVLSSNMSMLMPDIWVDGCQMFGCCVIPICWCKH